MIKEGFRADKLYTIHNSLAYEKQLAIRQQMRPLGLYKDHFGNDNPVLMFVGRLTKVKHLDLILEAMGILREQGEYYNLALVGDGEQRVRLEALSHELRLDKQVWFFGACYDEVQLGELIFNSDLCVSPGNVGLTAMHMMVFGTPVLTHNDFSWQMPEFEAIHDGSTGAYFERGNVYSLANAIRNWFIIYSGKREEVRFACFQEIDTNWNPQFQIRVLKMHLQ
jgi:glycosyltransferase involved in cell wall biosynthesis